MKKLKWIAFGIFSMFCIVACGKEMVPKERENYLISSMEQDFAYTKTTYYMDEAGLEKKSVLKGTYSAEPYEEHIVVEEAENYLWDEIIYSGNGEMITAKIHTPLSDLSGWIEQKVSRVYPYGYGEELFFKLVGEEEINGVICEVYTTEYITDVMGGIAGDEVITATVTQTWYIDKEVERLIRVDTDLTDLNEKTFVVNEINVNGSSLEEAEKKAEISNNFIKTEVFEIWYE